MVEIHINQLNLRDMHWDQVSDWSKLCPSKIGMFETEYVTKEDVFRFYDVIVKDIARKVGQDYEQVKEIIDEENTPFTQYVLSIFEKKKTYPKDDLQIRKLRIMLLVPQMDATLRNLLKLYKSLPSKQQEEFKKFIVEE